MIYAADTKAPLDRPEAKKLLMRFGTVEKAKGVVDELDAAAKRKAA